MSKASNLMFVAKEGLSKQKPDIKKPIRTMTSVANIFRTKKILSIIITLRIK